jgi:peptidoglycan biosynthesis protein MviN/MurJ (putative lipid II flippase)
MFLKAGAVSLALLLASRLLGLVRESALAAAFGASGAADVAVLMLTLPDWLTSVLASGALAYVLLPAWAAQSESQVASTQRKVALVLLAGSIALGLALVALRVPASTVLAAGVPAPLRGWAAEAIAWSAVAFPAALLAALWVTRLQHESDFTGMYGANLVVNAVLIASIALAAMRLDRAIAWMAAGLLVAMALRLGWLRWRMARKVRAPSQKEKAELPALSLWLWATLSAGLPIALPFAARSIASRGGEGSLAVFNYAWKLVELPLVLAVQLVATLAFPAIARAVAQKDAAAAKSAARAAFALAWALACAATAALLLGAPAVAKLLFGWGRMGPESLASVAHWGALGAWSLLPQALIAVALTGLAARRGMKPAVFAYAIALALLVAGGVTGSPDGGRLMVTIDVLLAGVAVVVVAALGSDAMEWLPWRSMAVSLAGVGVAQILATTGFTLGGALWMQGLAIACVAALAVIGATWWASGDLRAALAR